MFYCADSNFVSPIEINLGRNDSNEERSYFYVPILKFIKVFYKEALLNNKLDSSATEDRDDNKLCDVIDGTKFRESDFFDGKNLMIQLSSDAYKLCNPIGPSKNNHKTNGIYFKVMNLP